MSGLLARVRERGVGELAPHPITGGARSGRATGKDGVQEASSTDGAGGLEGVGLAQGFIARDAPLPLLASPSWTEQTGQQHLPLTESR